MKKAASGVAAPGDRVTRARLESSSAQTLRGYHVGSPVQDQAYSAHRLGNRERHMAELHEHATVDLPCCRDSGFLVLVQQGSKAFRGIAHLVHCGLQIVTSLEKVRVPLPPSGKPGLHVLEREAELRVLVLDPGKLLLNPGVFTAADLGSNARGASDLEGGDSFDRIDPAADDHALRPRADRTEGLDG